MGSSDFGRKMEDQIEDFLFVYDTWNGANFKSLEN